METMKKIILILLALIFTVSFSGCGEKKSEELPDVVLKGLPENEKVTSSLTVSGFKIDIYVTYAQVTAYEGSEKNVVIPSTAAGVAVKGIGEEAFKGSEVLECVTMPSSMLVIGRFAFENCKNLKTVVLNDGLETIGDYSFRNSSVEDINFPESVGYLGKYAFYNCENLRGEIKIPDSLSTAGKFAFYGCKNITGISFGRRFREISDNMFYNCTGLTAVSISQYVKKISSYAFAGCVNLETISIERNTETVGEGAFFDCPKLTIMCYNGSAAHKAAERNKYKYELLFED